MEPAPGIHEANQKFLRLFRVTRHREYFSTVLFDKEFGFSVKRKYDKKVQALLPEKDRANYIALLHVYIDEAELRKRESRKAIGIRVSMALDKEHLYIPEPQRLRWPVDFRSENNFYFDEKTKRFFKGDRRIQPIEMLDEMYEVHVKPCRLIRGAVFITKKCVLRFAASLLVLLSQILVILAQILVGDKYTWDHKRRAMETSYPKLFEKKDTVTATEAPKDEFFGFKASRWSLFMYCSIHLIVYLLFHNADYPEYLKKLFANTFLSVAYIFVSLTLYEKYLPLLFKWLIKKTTLSAQNVKYIPLSI